MPTNMDHWNGYHMLHHINNNQRADQIRGIRGKSRLLQTPETLQNDIHAELGYQREVLEDDVKFLWDKETLGIF